MAKFNSKTSGDQLTAAEYNDVQLPRQDLLDTAGITGVSGNNTQMSTAIANYTGVATFYNDNGVADAYVLDSIDNFRSPDAYIEGLEARFKATNSNTGASTVNVAGLGVVNIKRVDENGAKSDLVPGNIIANEYYRLIYDLTDFVLFFEPFIPTATLEKGTKNTIINGNFDFWNRSDNAVMGAGNPIYVTADRWAGYRGDAGVVTQSRQTFTLGQTDVPNNPRFYWRWDQTTGATSNPYFVQRIEAVETFAGENATLSFYMKADTNISVEIRAQQHFGSGGSPSADVETVVETINVTTSWQKFKVTMTLPSISGKIIGTNNTDYLGIRFILPDNTTFALDTAQVQLEQGSFATAFDLRPITTEKLLVTRYYEIIQSGGGVDINMGFNGDSEGSGRGSCFVPFTFKRSVPTITTSAASTFQVYNGTTSATANSIVSSSWQIPITSVNLDLGVPGNPFTNGYSSKISSSSTTNAFVIADAEL
jgi:hypothetical protein